MKSKWMIFSGVWGMILAAGVADAAEPKPNTPWTTGEHVKLAKADQQTLSLLQSRLE